MPERRVTRCPTRPYRFEDPFPGMAYALLLCIFTRDVSEEDQTIVSGGIVSSGCRYVVCYGERCSSWDDSIDFAQVADGEQKEPFVMTTWHDRDSAEEVTDFFSRNTAYDDFIPANFGVFILGSDPDRERAILDALTVSEKTD